MRNWIDIWVFAFVCVLHAVVIQPVTLGQDSRIEQELAVDSPMLSDPVLIGPERRVAFDPRLKELWLEALDRPEADLRRQAADAIGRAYVDGFQELADTSGLLLTHLERESHQLVQLALAGALGRLNDTSAAGAIFELNVTGTPEMVLLTDPILADWSYEPAVELWHTRAVDRDLDLSVRVSAIQSLGRLGIGDTAELTGLALDRNDPVVLRLAAARAISEPSDESELMLNAADGLAQGTIEDRLVGVTILSMLRDGSALDSLSRYARDESTTVVAVALGTIVEIDPAAALALEEEAVVSKDANVRFQIARALYRVGSPSTARLLSGLLDDPDPATRRFARWALIQFDADDNLSPVVRELAGEQLMTDSWRALEQAALLLGQLDDEEVSARLAELLRHDRREVRLAAATALRWQAAPDTFVQMQERAEEISDEAPRILADETEDERVRRAVFDALNEEVTQLFEAFGESRYTDALPVMMRYIPKNSGYNAGARAAAIWAIGKIRESQPDAELTRALVGRLSDNNPMNPEAAIVRGQAAIALGRTRTEDALGPLRRFYEEENGSKEIGGSCRWAIQVITGEDLPPLKPIVFGSIDWFLVPLD